MVVYGEARDAVKSGHQSPSHLGQGKPCCPGVLCDPCTSPLLIKTPNGLKLTLYGSVFLALVVKVRPQRAKNLVLKEVFSLGDVSGSRSYKKTCKRRLCSEWIERRFRWNEGAVL